MKLAIPRIRRWCGTISWLLLLACEDFMLIDTILAMPNNHFVWTGDEKSDRETAIRVHVIRAYAHCTLTMNLLPHPHSGLLNLLPRHLHRKSIKRRKSNQCVQCKHDSCCGFKSNFVKVSVGDLFLGDALHYATSTVIERSIGLNSQMVFFPVSIEYRTSDVPSILLHSMTPPCV